MGWPDKLRLENLNGISNCFTYEYISAGSRCSFQRARRPGHSQRYGCDESLRGICNRLQTATNWGKISK